jgi:hypothetical protein
MSSNIFLLSLLTTALTLTATFADGASPASTSGGIRISITNEYEANIDFGFLGKGSRGGVDVVEGVLNREGSQYVGVVDAHVVSEQQLRGLGGTGNCGPETYDDSQKLRVIGRHVNGFNTDVQSIVYRIGGSSNEHLLLEFVPDTTPTLPSRSANGDLIVNCHTLIETTTARASVVFLPLNDSRWTQPGGGYIVAVPSSGVLEYVDYQVPEGDTATLGPFQVKKSMWLIRVERLPAGSAPVPPPGAGGQPPSAPGGCPQNPSQGGASSPGSQQPCAQPSPSTSTPK